MFDGQTYSPRLDADRLKNNLGRVLNLLLDGQWHTIDELRAVGGSAGDSRARDLRKDRFGGFAVEAMRDNHGGMFVYRIDAETVTPDQINTFTRTVGSGRGRKPKHA